MSPPPRALLPLTQTLPVFDATATRHLEHSATPATSHPSALMERAGLAAARLVRALAPQAHQLAVLCGPGNNGGDGWVTAWHLHRWGVPVTAHAVGGASRSADHSAAFQRARASGLPIREGHEPDLRCDFVVDALLGIGLHSEPRGELAEGLRALRAHPARKLALDLPSGLDGDTGRDWGAAACEDTLTFLTAKPGLFTGAGRALAGRIWLEELGVPAQGESPCAQLVGAEQLMWWRSLSPRARNSHATHKGRQGDLWVLGGSMPGAALLAARAGLLAGAGRVYLTGRMTEDSQQPELILQPLPNSSLWHDATAVAGCGGGPSTSEWLESALRCVKRLILDADGLNAVAARSELQEQLRQRRQRGASTILTPHPLEAARLLGISAAEVQADRLRAAQELAQHLECTVLLKGSGSVIAHPGRLALINTTGHGALASAGTGDVLAGWLGGLWAQAPQACPQELAALAAAWHGLAADQAPPGSAPLPASQLVQRMHALHPH